MPHAVPLSPPEQTLGAPARPGATAQVAGVVAFPVIGGVLAVTGMPVGDVLVLISGCGMIGAATVALAGGRLAGALASAAVRAAQEPRP